MSYSVMNLIPRATIKYVPPLSHLATFSHSEHSTKYLLNFRNTYELGYRAIEKCMNEIFSSLGL